MWIIKTHILKHLLESEHLPKQEIHEGIFVGPSSTL